MRNESQELDHMGRIPALGKRADEDGQRGTVHEALGSDHT